MLRLRKRILPAFSMCGICGRVNSHNHVNADGDVLHTFIHPADSITEPVPVDKPDGMLPPA